MSPKKKLDKPAEVEEAEIKAVAKEAGRRPKRRLRKNPSRKK